MFGQEITEYIDEIYKHGLNLWRLREEYRDSTQQPDGYDHQKVAKEEMDKELEWFMEQPNLAREKFKKYLFIGK